MCVKMILAYRPFIILFLFLNIHHLLSKITSCLEYAICGEISAYIMFFHTNISFYRESMPMHSQSNWNSIRMPISCQCRDIPKYINNNNCVVPLVFNVLWSFFLLFVFVLFPIYIILSIERNVELTIHWTILKLLCSAINFKTAYVWTHFINHVGNANENNGLHICG